MVKAECCHFSRGTDLQKLLTAKRTNGFLADNQIWEAQGPWFSEIYVCKSPQGGGGFRYLARGLYTRACQYHMVPVFGISPEAINRNISNESPFAYSAVCIQNTTQKATIHQVITMLAASKNGVFPGHNHLLTISVDDPTL